MAAQIIAIIIFLVMFALIISDKIERHIVTLCCACTTLIVVFGICFKSGVTSYESQGIGEAQMRILPDHQAQRHDPGHLLPRRASQAASGLNFKSVNFNG